VRGAEWSIDAAASTAHSTEIGGHAAREASFEGLGSYAA